MERTDIFNQITTDMVTTYKNKNADYGDAFLKVRREFPIGVLIRLSDKLERCKVLMNKDYEPKVDESIEDTLLDMANYAVMELVERRKDKEALKMHCE